MSGELVVKYEYDAWGNIIAETNATGGTPTTLVQYWSVINPFRYRGYYYDSEIGLYYLQSRYYDAETGRFINQDSYVSTGTGLLGINMFAYCDNNPVNGWDPTGERTFECCPHGDCASCKAKKKASQNEGSIDFLDAIVKGVKDIYNSLVVRIGGGVGYGASGSYSGVEYGAEVYFNFVNIEATSTTTKIYSSFYLGFSMSQEGIEFSPEIHYIFDWEKMQWLKIESETCHLMDFEISGSYYNNSI